MPRKVPQMIPRQPRNFPSLSITDKRPRGIFVDRWGTLLELPRKGHCAKPEELRFHEGAIDALFRAQQAGWNLYVIGNEESVAHGRQSDASWARVQAAIVDALARQGVVLRRDYACLEHPQGTEPHCQDSVFRLPNTGIFHHAAHVDDLALEHSWVIGDSTLELVAAWRAGCHIASVETGLKLGDETFEVQPAYRAADLREALLALIEATSALRW